MVLGPNWIHFTFNSLLKSLAYKGIVKVYCEARSVTMVTTQSQSPRGPLLPSCPTPYRTVGPLLFPQVAGVPGTNPNHFLSSQTGVTLHVT